MLKIFVIILVIVFSKFLEGWERDNSKVFWGLSALLVLTVSLFDEGQFQKIQNSGENNVSSVLAITSGGDGSKGPRFFVPLHTPTGKSSIDRYTDSEPKNDRPKLPWGADLSYRAPLGGGGGGSSGSNNVEEKHRIPDEPEWINNQAIWDVVQENDSSVSKQEENKAPSKLGVDIDFPYQYDSNGNPNLLIPTTGRLRKKRTYTTVEYDQTAVHMHHASDFDIQLPSDFNMSKYENLDRAGRLDYVNQNVPREIVINYQNAIGQSMCSRFNKQGTTISVPGFAGTHKIGTELIFQQKPDNKNINTISIIREDGTHISSFSVNVDAINKIIDNDFWVLRDRNL